MKMNRVIQRVEEVKEWVQTVLMELWLMMITNQDKAEVIFLQGEEVVQEEPVGINKQRPWKYVLLALVKCTGSNTLLLEGVQQYTKDTRIRVVRNEEKIKQSKCSRLHKLGGYIKLYLIYIYMIAYQCHLQTYQVSCPRHESSALGGGFKLSRTGSLISRLTKIIALSLTHNQKLHFQQIYLTNDL